VGLGFLGVLSTQAQLYLLNLRSNTFASENNLFQVLGALTSLRELTIWLTLPSPELRADMLSSLTKLTALNLACSSVDGLHVLLPQLSSLEKLVLSDALISAKEGIWASSSLRELSVARMSPVFPELSLSALPALQNVELTEILLFEGMRAGLSDADKLQKLHTMAKWLAALPLCMTYDGEALLSLTLQGNTDWSAEFCVLPWCVSSTPPVFCVHNQRST